MTDKNSISLRYHDKGNVHMDFHGATNTTINFIIEKYGIETMNDIFKKVGNDVYADMKKHIQSGNIIHCFNTIFFYNKIYSSICSSMKIHMDISFITIT